MADYDKYYIASGGWTNNPKFSCKNLAKCLEHKAKEGDYLFGVYTDGGQERHVPLRRFVDGVWKTASGSNQTETGKTESPDLAQAILRISESVDRLRDSGLNHRAIVALIYDDTKIAKRTIEGVLSSLGTLAKNYTNVDAEEKKALTRRKIELMMQK